MKNKLASDHHRATLGALFAIVGFALLRLQFFTP